jgi:Ca2+-binding EF-hand superfamily protein
LFVCFRSLFSQCFSGVDCDKLAKRIFNMYDKNRDGTISFRELMAVMYVMSNGTPEDNLREIFRVLVDRNI